jgi:hypothetical protein
LTWISRAVASATSRCRTQHVARLSLVVVGPELRLVGHLDELDGDPHPAAAAAHAALEDGSARASSRPISPTRLRVSLNIMLEVRAITPRRSGLRRESCAIISSVRPSLK